MARWTQTSSELTHIKKVLDDWSKARLALVVLKNGRQLEGVIATFSLHNDPNGRLSSMLELQLKQLDGVVIRIDALDVEDIHDVWDARSEDYVKAGIITIVDRY